MEIETFKQKLKTCQKSSSMVSQGIKVYKYFPTEWYLVMESKKDVCSKCGTNLNHNPVRLTIYFTNPIEHITIFQTGML